MVQGVPGAAVMVRADITEILNSPSCAVENPRQKSVSGGGDARLKAGTLGIREIKLDSSGPGLI